jgi:hypothetical protein
MEVIVMLFACHFVPRCVARNLHRLEPFLLYQVLNVSIDRGDSESSMMPPSDFQGLIGRQRPVRLEEGRADRGLLFCLALFHLYQK